MDSERASPAETMIEASLEHADLTRDFEHLVVQLTLAPAGVRFIDNAMRFLYHSANASSLITVDDPAR